MIEWAARPAARARAGRLPLTMRESIGTGPGPIQEAESIAAEPALGPERELGQGLEPGPEPALGLGPAALELGVGLELELEVALAARVALAGGKRDLRNCETQ